MTCITCKHWQGTRYSEWADCYHVIGHIEPRLFEEKDERGFYFTTPFDPQDVRFYHSNSKFSLYYRDAVLNYPEQHKSWWKAWGLRVEKCGGKYFFQTRKDYKCKFYHE